MLYFNRENQEQIYLNNLQKGRVFKQASVKGTNFNKFVKWIAKSFEWLVDRYNETFKGLYICESQYFIEQFKKDYNIPNKVFYSADAKEHRKDIYVLRYLMTGNTELHFKSIANIYGVNIGLKIKDCKDEARFNYVFPIVFDEPCDVNRFSLDFPIMFGEYEQVHKTLIVAFYRDRVDGFLYNFPIEFNEERVIIKIRKLFDIIKPAHIEIEYVYKEPNEDELLKFCLTGE